MPICVAGMPCSGTSMVARVLSDLGLDVGPEEELVDSGGAFEGAHAFSRLNDEILDALGAAWDSPPDEDERWVGRAELQPLRQRAAVVADALALAEPWGWADPRNTLTLPFWRELFPDLRVVVCVRHPLEVAGSLEARGSTSFARGLTLWRSYYSAAAELDDEGRIVTNYARYHEEPKEEVERLAKAVGLRPSRGEISRAVASLARRSREEARTDDAELPPDVHGLYRTLLEAAAARSRAQPMRSGLQPIPAAEPSGADERTALEAQRLELEHLRLELARRRGQAETLQAQLDVRAASDHELTNVIHNFEEQLLERDEEIATLREDIGRRLHAEDSLRRAVDALEKELATVESTRLWRVGKGYWSLKASIRQALRRERS